MLCYRERELKNNQAALHAGLFLLLRSSSFTTLEERKREMCGWTRPGRVHSLLSVELVFALLSGQAYNRIEMRRRKQQEEEP